MKSWMPQSQFAALAAGRFGGLIEPLQESGSVVILQAIVNLARCKSLEVANEFMQIAIDGCNQVYVVWHNDEAEYL